MKNFNFFEKLWEHSRTLRRVGLVLVMCLIAIPQLWAYNLERAYLKYNFNGGDDQSFGVTDDNNYTDDKGTLTGSFTLKGIYIISSTGSGDNWTGGKMGYTIYSLSIGGETSEETIEPDDYKGYKYGSNAASERQDQWEGSIDIASNTSNSGIYYFKFYFVSYFGYGNDIPKPGYGNKKEIKYTVLPPSVSSYTVTATGKTSGTGTELDPYIVPYGGTLQLDLSGASQGHTDTHSSIQYSVDNSSWGTETSNTRKVISNITKTTEVQNWVVYAKYHNSDDNLDGTTNSKTIYYKAAAPTAGTVFYKFKTKPSSLGTKSVCGATSTEYPQTTSNSLSALYGGTLKAFGTGSLTQLKFNEDSYNFNGSNNTWLIIDLDCPLAEGDVIRYVNYGKSSSTIDVQKTRGTSASFTLAGSGTRMTQTITVPAAFAGVTTLYLTKKAGNDSYLMSFEIIRPYTLTLNAHSGSVSPSSLKVPGSEATSVLPHASYTNYWHKGWFAASSGGDAVANPYTATGSTTLHAQYDACSSKTGSIYKFLVKSTLTAGSPFALTENTTAALTVGDYLNTLYGGTLDAYGRSDYLTNTTSALTIKSTGSYLLVTLDCPLRDGDQIKSIVSGSSVAITTSSSRSTTNTLATGTNTVAIPAGFKGASTIYIWKNSSDGSISHFEIIRPAYTVTAETSTGTTTYGTVSAGASSLAQGGTTTITAVPADGYQVASWAVSGTGASIDPSGTSNSTTTELTMGSANATVTVTFEAISSCSAPTSPSISGTTSYSAGNNISLTASATGTDGSTTYQWYKGDPENGGESQGDASTDGATFTKNSCVTGDAGTYYCVISNGEDCDVTTYQAITVSCLTAPSAVTSLTNSAHTATSLTYTWTKASNASGYTATLYSDEDCAVSVEAKALGDVATATFTGLTPNATYYCKVQSKGNGTVYCEDGGTTSEVSGTTDAPTAPTFSPASGSTVSGSQTITITGHSGSTVYYAWATSAQDAAAIYNGGSGSHGIANAGTASTTVQSGKTLYAISRLSDVNSTVSSASYTVDATAPTLSSSVPEDGATNVNTSGNIVLTFSENVTIVDASKFSLSGGTLSTGSATVSTNTVTIPYSGLSNSTEYTFSTAAGAVRDAVGNTNAALEDISFTTKAAASLTALVSGTLYRVADIVTGTTCDDVSGYGTTEHDFWGTSSNNRFKLLGGDGTALKAKQVTEEETTGKDFDGEIYIFQANTNHDETTDPTQGAIEFVIPSSGTLTVWPIDKNGSQLEIKKSGVKASGEYNLKTSNATTYSVAIDVTAGTYYIYAPTKSKRGLYGLQFDATDDKTEPTVTWSGVPATVYPGQQFTFTVETNTDATPLNVSNLTATNATLVNKSIEGGVFTATARIAADAAAAPTFTLSTAEGTTYSAKVDTKLGIILGSCESSSGTATLFAFTCTSTTTAINTYSATGGTATLSSSAMSTSGSNEVTISDQTFYKFNSSSQWTMALTSGTFAVGDVITFTMACNTSSDKSGKGVMLISSSSDTIPVTRNYPKNTAQTSSYTVSAGDGIAGQNSFTIKRNDSDIKFGSITITRDGQTINSKQETTIEWPETVDGVRVVEYDAENPNITSLAIISSIGTPEYSSNNEDVGSFRDGNVELTGATGNVTITVSVPAVGCMEAAESSYVLTVTNKRYTVEKGTITGAGCNVSISETSVPSGDIVTLTPVPATGYSLTAWDVYKKDDSSTKVTVTNNRFTMPAYDVVVDATFTAKSTVTTLSALSVTNTDTEEDVALSPTFASGTTAYTATLRCGTASAPRISATKTDSKATVRLTNVSDLSSATDADRTATILVTAEDGTTTQTYTIVFTVSDDDCVRLSPTITSLSGDENICSGGRVDLSIEAASRNNDGGTLSYQWQKYNGASWDNITGATETEYTTDAITAETQFRCVVTDTKDASAESTESDEITIGVTSISTPTNTQSANVVTLSCATEGATIWYSTDGNDPAANADNSRQGTSVSITQPGVTVKAIAYLDGCHSNVMTLSNADYSASVAGSITWAMTNAGKAEAPKFSATCVPNTVLSAATAFQLSRGATYDKDKKENMSVKISGITSYDENGKHVTLAVTVAEGYTFTPCSLSVDYQPVSKAAQYKAVIGSNTSSESSSVSGGSHSAQRVNFTSATPISAGTDSLHLYVYGTDLVTWRVAGNIILYGTVQATGTTYYSVTYNRNGATSGSVPVDDKLYENGEEVELAANTGGLAKDGYIFSGWATTPSGTVLTSNPTISSSDLTLYAVWTEDASAGVETCAEVTTSGTNSSIAVGDYSLYFSSSNSEYSSGSVKSSTANKCEGDYRYYMPGVVVALTSSNASTIKLKGQQDYDVTVSKVMVADALDGAWREISYTPIAYSSSSCGVLGISGVQIAQGKYVFLGFSGGAKNEFRISGLCITPFVDACPAITIVNNPVGDTWAQGATGVQISVGATTDAGVLNYQWQESTDNTNFSDIDAATATTYNVPTGTVGTKYYRCVVSNGSCSKNSESAKMVIVEPTVTALYDYWYIKQSRQTPDIALFEVTKGTPASNVTIPAAEIGKYGFVYNTSDYKIYLQGSAPSAIYSDEDVEVTASIKSNSNADNITLHLLRATPHPQLAFVVTGDKGAGFENYNTDQITSDLYTQLALEYVIQPTNIYHTTDEKAIRAYYSQFDIILNTDYPDTQIGPNSNSGQWNVGYVNALGTMVDIVPILTMEAFISRLPNWKIKQDPKSPSTNQYKMLLNCRAHEIFTGIPDGNMGTEIVNGEEHKVVTIVDENDYDTKKKALQGFAADDLADMDVVGQIHNGTGQLMACVERQYETTARMMVLGINSSAMEKLTEDGIKVVKNALLYLQHKSAKDVNDCSVKFTNNEGAGNGQWSTASNWSTGVVPSHENKVIILADCELDAQAHVDMVKINEDVKLTIKPTGALIVDGTITRFNGEDWLAQDGNITSDNLVVEADASHTGALILSNPDSKIGAEVQMYSKAHYDNENSKDLWQFVAIPIVSASRWNMGDWAYVFNNAGGDWDYYRDVYSAFDGIGLTQDDETTYTFRGPLASTKTQNITLYYGNGNDDRTLIGNSWTAPIQIVNFDESKDFGTATPTVYVYNTGFDAVKGQSAYAEEGASAAAGSWYTIPIGSAKTLIAAGTWVSLTEIPAMQTFEVQNTSGANTTLKLDYDALVRKNASSLNQHTPMYAPRRANNNVEIPSMRITLVDEATRSDVYLLKADRFTNGFEGGWDGDYRVDDDADYTQFYIVQETGKLAISAQPEMDGTFLGFVAGRNASYTITFRYNGNEELYFNDLETQQSTLITDENEYTFMAERGENGNRFLIGGRLFGAPEITTGVTNLDAEDLDVQKVIYNDKLFIIRGGKVFSADGQLVK